MIFSSIRLKEGLSERVIEFSPEVNLIHSGFNSCGKTTLLRFMLYSLGYNVPSTKRIKFNQCEVESKLKCESVGDVTLLRYRSEFVEATIDGEKQTFVLPAQLHNLHQKLFGTDNADILENILGAFYIDQEKGWTLLNRGVVIGSLRFNIEELIRGLAGVDCSKQIIEQKRLERDIEKYRQMFSIAQYRESVQKEIGSVVFEVYEDQINSEIDHLSIQKNNLQAELRRIDRILTDNRRFKQFVVDMKLLVRGPDDIVIQVTKDNIVGLDDAIELLVAKRQFVANELTAVEKALSRIMKEKTNEEQQLEFMKSESMVEVFDKQILSMPMNQTAIKNEIEKLSSQLKSIQKEIEYLTKHNNSIIYSLHDNIVRYATELGLSDSAAITPSYLFTSNLKELSGAVLHKTVFAFRLAYIIAIEDVLKIKLPIILDSPSGKEVDQENIKRMMDILKRDFSDHQIIIASIFEYDFEAIKKIEIQGRLIQ